MLNSTIVGKLTFFLHVSVIHNEILIKMATFSRLHQLLPNIIIYFPVVHWHNEVIKGAITIIKNKWSMSFTIYKKQIPDMQVRTATNLNLR